MEKGVRYVKHIAFGNSYSSICIALCDMSPWNSPMFREIQGKEMGPYRLFFKKHT